jgi:anti-sigma factor RsiW
VSCERSREALYAHLDGEVDVAEALDVENHLRSCPACAAEYGRAVALRAVLRDGGLRAIPPPALAERIRAALSVRRAEPRGRPLWKAMALAAALLLGVALGRFLIPASGFFGTRNADDALVDSHLRALGAGPLTQVLSSDRHTVKPWFAGKLEFSPKVPDLAGEGFLLEGGRVDRRAGRPAAALVYKRGNHVIDLYVTLAGAPGSPAAATSGVRGFHIVRWTEGDLAYAAVSDLNEEQLLAFADLVRR